MVSVLASVQRKINAASVLLEKETVILSVVEAKAMVEYIEAVEDLGVAAVENDSMLPQWQRFEEARKALNE